MLYESRNAQLEAWVESTVNSNWRIVLWAYAFILEIIATITAIFYLAHSDEPKLRAECEARGGVLISAGAPLYVCVQPK